MSSVINQLRAAGVQAIASEQATGAQIPLEQDGVVFQQMFEYPVRSFPEEVGFYAEVLGFTPIALTNDYALFTHPRHHYCLSFRLDASAPDPSTIGLKLLFMTRNIPAADAHLEQTGLIPSRTIFKGSPVQDVISFETPSGVAVEIWEDPTPVEGD